MKIKGIQNFKISFDLATVYMQAIGEHVLLKK